MEETKPIRILHVIGIMNRGGAETMIMNLYRNIDRTKVQFDFVENSFDEAVFDEEIKSLGGKIYRCPHYVGKNHFVYVKWWKEFFNEHANEYSAVHGHLGSTAAIYLSIAKKYGIFTIAHSHNVRTQYTLMDILYAIYSYPTRFIADSFLGCSKAATISRFGKRIAENDEKCKILKNAIDVKCFDFNPDIRNKIRKQYNLDGKYVVGHVGRFERQKNHDFLLDVFNEVHKQNQNAVLLLVGDGLLRQEIECKIETLGLKESVIMTGVVSNVNEFYQAMDVFVFPSLYEGLPLTIIESQSSGLPSVLSNMITKEAAISDLVTFLPLENNCESWAEKLLSYSNAERKSGAFATKEAGYGIHETSIWLTNYYRKLAKENE